MSKLYESHVGKTRYTAEFDRNDFVKFTRYNKDGKTDIWFPFDLIWSLMLDRFRERLYKRFDHLLFKDLAP